MSKKEFFKKMKIFRYQKVFKINNIKQNSNIKKLNYFNKNLWKCLMKNNIENI